MSYSSADFQTAVLLAFTGRGLLPADADPQSPEEAAEYVLDALDRVTARLQPAPGDAAGLAAALREIVERWPGDDEPELTAFDGTEAAEDYGFALACHELAGVAKRALSPDPKCSHTDTAGGICLNCGNDQGAQ